MKLIFNINRELRIFEPTEMFSGDYTTDVNYQGDLTKLKKRELFNVLAKEGLKYSEINIAQVYGFNDEKVMGIEAVIRANAEGNQPIWITLGDRIIQLEIAPVIFKIIGYDKHVNYATKILEKIVPFVETRTNYEL